MARPARPIRCATEVRPGLLPFGPLAERFGELGLHTAPQIADYLGRDQHEVRRWARDGIGFVLADRLAVLAGRHPFVVWGDAWFDVGPEGPGGRRQAFTMDDARSIRARHASGVPLRVLAAEFGVDRNSVRQIVDGRTYREAV